MLIIDRDTFHQLANARSVRFQNEPKGFYIIGNLIVFYLFPSLYWVFMAVLFDPDRTAFIVITLVTLAWVGMGVYTHLRMKRDYRICRELGDWTIAISNRYCPHAHLLKYRRIKCCHPDFQPKGFVWRRPPKLPDCNPVNCPLGMSYG